jgi:beta-mannosidase
VDLSGQWRALPADDDLRRGSINLETDDSAWPQVSVPGHWQRHREFLDHDGPLLYRTRFEMEPPATGRRRWVTFDGLFYQADVWLDGAYLGDPEGTFVHSAFEITSLAALSSEHVLAVELACPPQSANSAKRTITGVYQAWEGIDQNWNPGGISGPVRVVDTGPVRIERFRVLCRDADATRAHLLLSARLDADTTRTIRLRTSIDGRRVAETEHSLAGGANEVEWNLDIEEPPLWWPRALGAQPLTTVDVEVVVEGISSDTASRRTGLREVAWNNWVCSINGERIFLKGANLLPTRLAAADATDEEMRADIALAAAAGLDALRVHGHIAPQQIYQAADELGILLLQDFPLTGSYTRSVRAQAVEQARAAVDLLGHHPSIVSWAAHDNPVGSHLSEASSGPLRRFAAQQKPSWNRTVLDRWVKRSFERADPTRPCVAQSGALPHLPTLDGTDSHLSLGWASGEHGDIVKLARRLPRLVRFVSEFGAQAVPDSNEFIDHGAWPELDWEHLARHHGAQTGRLTQRVPPQSFGTFDQWCRATQMYQAELIRHHIETLRRLKYRPTGGFCVFALNDPAPLLSFAVLDHRRRPKLGYAAMKAACSPVAVIADRPPEVLESGQQINLQVHVVNDFRHEISAAVVEVVASWADDEQHWSFSGAVEADACVLVGTVVFEVPRTLGIVSIELRLTAGAITATNHYSSAVVVAPQ